MARITAHAIQRYRERVDDVEPNIAREMLRSFAPIIDRAAAFGCDTIVLGNGARLKLKGATVCTVLQKRGV